MKPSTFLKKIGFNHVADYTKNSKDKIQCKKKPEYEVARGDKVYCLIRTINSAEKILYVGETYQSKRMFQYGSNKEMKKVYAELKKQMKNNCEVKVWVFQDFRKCKVSLAKESFKIGRLGLEAILIDRFQPIWNRKKSNLTSPVPRPADFAIL